MQAKAMRREFSFQGPKLPDPDPKMSVEDVRGVLAMQYPEIATAAISGPEAVGGHDEVCVRARDRLEGLTDDDTGSGAMAGRPDCVRSRPWRWSAMKPKIRSKNKGRRDEVLAESELLALFRNLPTPRAYHRLQRNEAEQVKKFWRRGRDSNPLFYVII
jgi:PRTRC genetic system protein C